MSGSSQRCRSPASDVSSLTDCQGSSPKRTRTTERRVTASPARNTNQPLEFDFEAILAATCSSGLEEVTELADTRDSLPKPLQGLLLHWAQKTGTHSPQLASVVRNLRFFFPPTQLPPFVPRAARLGTATGRATNTVFSVCGPAALYFKDDGKHVAVSQRRNVVCDPVVGGKFEPKYLTEASFKCYRGGLCGNEYFPVLYLAVQFVPGCCRATGPGSDLFTEFEALSKVASSNPTVTYSGGQYYYCVVVKGRKSYFALKEIFERPQVKAGYEHGDRPVVALTQLIVQSSSREDGMHLATTDQATVTDTDVFFVGLRSEVSSRLRNHFRNNA